ncbi:MAG: A24 family peptidase [bacterium]
MDRGLIQAIPILLLAVILLIAAISDFRTRKIPNRLTFPTAAVGIIYHTCVSGWKGLLFSTAGVVAGLALLMVFYLMGGMGAGDVKLMGAVGGLLGPEGVLAAFVGTALIGGIYAVGLLAVHGDLPDMVRRYGIMLKTFFFTHRMVYIPPENRESRPVLCYGLAIAIGTLLSVFIRVI